MHYACTKRPHFHFRSKISHQHRVPRPPCTLRRENFGNRPYIRVILHIFHCACVKQPYFHFRSKIWRHRRVPWPRFLLRCGNFGDSRTVHLRHIEDFLIFAWVFRTSWPKLGVLGQNRGRVVWYWPPNELVFPFGGFYVCANFGENQSINATVRVPTDGHTETLTDWQKQTDFIICPMLYTIAMGQIIMINVKKTCQFITQCKGDI